ncbi:ABC transporter substrate-binding protein [Thiohalophilus thiocyanatoxydans]|uniref:NitT/TauT family transport system substrate-binding protein n=1 Tax=Thiohalophilus thiocyanatoxydans TaxID=381308 RepID=A0A4R8IJM5_9GAMM|nr:ABC transporter substrate-binding protein [Thiohalophilus thiocyanatoxydans]TDY00936.1 NitT/TauT family transport system substrate-binding protein [Thiohalophilus thiocyanatoxydans]
MQTIHIRVLRHSAFYSPLLATMSAGFLEAEGLQADYTVVDADHPLEAGIRDGTVQVAQAAPAVSFAYLERGESPPYRHFAPINERDGFFLAARHSEPDFNWSRLPGKQVLVDHLFQPLAMFRYALHRQGIDPAGVGIIDAGDVAAMDNAFRNGEGDYIHQQGPAPQQLEHEGLAHVVASVGEVIGPVAFSSLCASETWLQSDMARAFMRAYCRAQRHVIDTPAAQLAKEEQHFFPGIDPQVLTQTIAAYQKLGCWQDSPHISPASYETLLDVFEADGQISRRHAYETVISSPPA